ncbi:MAG: hypothetical protein KDJ77_13005 [Rhodobiaceae bacterium]|nr:hypothetical protein [Rhodobiaceae bacterium]
MANTKAGNPESNVQELQDEQLDAVQGGVQGDTDTSAWLECCEFEVASAPIVKQVITKKTTTSNG